MEQKTSPNITPHRKRQKKCFGLIWITSGERKSPMPKSRRWHRSCTTQQSKEIPSLFFAEKQNIRLTTELMSSNSRCIFSRNDKPSRLPVRSDTKVRRTAATIYSFSLSLAPVQLIAPSSNCWRPISRPLRSAKLVPSQFTSETTLFPVWDLGTSVLGGRADRVSIVGIFPFDIARGTDVSCGFPSGDKQWQLELHVKGAFSLRAENQRRFPLTLRTVCLVFYLVCSDFFVFTASLSFLVLLCNGESFS